MCARRLYAELQRGQLEALITEREEHDVAPATTPSAAAQHVSASAEAGGAHLLTTPAADSAATAPARAAAA